MEKPMPRGRSCSQPPTVANALVRASLRWTIAFVAKRSLVPRWCAHAAAHRGASTAGDGEEGIEGRAWLHEGDDVSGADEGGRVGFSLGELEGECGHSGHAAGENDVAVDVDDGNRDGYVLFERLGLVSDSRRRGE
jgi:hypothetical protein